VSRVAWPIAVPDADPPSVSFAGPRATTVAGALRHTPRRTVLNSPFQRVVETTVAPLSATVAALLFVASRGALATAVLVWVVTVLSERVVRRPAEHAAFLPFMGRVYPAFGPALAFGALLFLKATSVVAGLTVVELVVVCATPAILTHVVIRFPIGRAARGPALRVAVVGSPATADVLAAEVHLHARRRIDVVGYIAAGAGLGARPGEAHDVRLIGTLGHLADTVLAHRIDLLLVDPEVSRPAFFEELASTCLHLPVNAMELTRFYERTFGHVALTAINVTWFEWLMHPPQAPTSAFSKRVLDVVVSCIALAVMAPVLALLALLVSRDGGPILFRQVRVGERGRPFQMYKLRSMAVEAPDAPAEWSVSDDVRVTRLGRILRRTHLDELPQFVNVLRGEMSVVGPRPEQPAFVAQLERDVPFYSRRHLLRPGITGWAQVRCGYSGTAAGSTLKVCHDLYYLKQRSLALDLLILGETVRTFFADHQWDQQPETRILAVGRAHGGIDMLRAARAATATRYVVDGSLAVVPEQSRA
jgi:exopolysaccharide biosynthesis polyprenyl glycosylphosphotransferase